MKSRFLFSTAAVAVLAPALAFAQTRTPWQMHQGLEVTPSNPLGLLQFSCSPPQHGAVCEYDVATVPSEADAGWGPAPDGEIIALNMTCGQSRVCQAPGGQTCLRYGDFSYFQTLVDIPANVVVTTFTITFRGMDDGSRVSLYNSAYPGGLVIPGSYVFLGGSGTTNLGPYVLAGEINRVVITQVDDCCCENHLQEARVVLNGDVIQSGCSGNSACEDGNACTADICESDGSCSHDALSCDDANACTSDSCNAASGCAHETITCDDANVCTIDACDTASGCANTPVSCDDGNTCTVDQCDPMAGCANVDQCPSCDLASATLASIWPPNHKLVTVGVQGVSDPQGQSTAITFDAIAQDEPTNSEGDGDTCPDASGVGSATAQVRAERAGTKKTPGDGRVYHLFFTATDPDGYSCSGSVVACVPHDLGNSSSCVDQGALYDSLICTP